MPQESSLLVAAGNQEMRPVRPFTPLGWLGVGLPGGVSAR